ncbi:hypothetical protein Herbaro_18510 [Herbaspirillum sp. WKF16]|uniref:hypothetical protein n=1 Tax=Herbaspirillum sp. WKF16 TaxID=3028312 RepID=UPI0023A9436F|nr:hypothetical protein [Herbaspirillum sp. WKF16]WDZ95450.1 hypothetical protein Herbaro_18510 [Herbaspirillum sp. WKF16]
MKTKSMFMLALGSLALATLARPAMRRADEIIRRRRGETLSGLPATLNEEDMQAVAQESSVVADGTQAHAPRKDPDLAPPVGA